MIPPLAIEYLRSADSIVVFTGAGISAESGIPTFRDAMSGLWSKFDPVDLATPEAFDRDPKLVSQWYDERRCQVANCQPNAGHIALANLERIAENLAKRFTLITQNVDRLHQAAGSSNVIELHGTLWVWRCLDCARESEERGGAFESYPLKCPCGGLRRPGVVWFGEQLPASAMLRAARATDACDLFLSIGTSSVVYPAAGLIEQAIGHGAKVVEINPQPTPFSDKVHCSIRANSGEALPRLLQEVAFGLADDDFMPDRQQPRHADQREKL
jgi:NAD-dependent deacetylase